jgi:NADPH:quinone reductase-like Zn-dependent oxidoreductase
MSFHTPLRKLTSLFLVRGQTAFSRNLVAELAAFVAANNLKPVIAAEYSFEEVVPAFEALQKQNAVGKIVVKISD